MKLPGNLIVWVNEGDEFAPPLACMENKFGLEKHELVGTEALYVPASEAEKLREALDFWERSCKARTVELDAARERVKQLEGALAEAAQFLGGVGTRNADAEAFKIAKLLHAEALGGGEGK